MLSEMGLQPTSHMGHTSLDRRKFIQMSFFFYFEPKIHICLRLPHENQHNVYNWIRDNSRNIQLKKIFGPPGAPWGSPKKGQIQNVAILVWGGWHYGPFEGVILCLPLVLKWHHPNHHHLHHIHT